MAPSTPLAPLSNTGLSNGSFCMLCLWTYVLLIRFPVAPLSTSAMASAALVCPIRVAMSSIDGRLSDFAIETMIGSSQSMSNTLNQFTCAIPDSFTGLCQAVAALAWQVKNPDSC
jgi:hypothetical protein